MRKILALDFLHRTVGTFHFKFVGIAKKFLYRLETVLSPVDMRRIAEIEITFMLIEVVHFKIGCRNTREETASRQNLNL